jgi:hypothetical protein
MSVPYDSVPYDHPSGRRCFWAFTVLLVIGLTASCGYEIYKWMYWSPVYISIGKGCAVSRPVVDGWKDPDSTDNFVYYYLSPGRHRIECLVNKRPLNATFDVPAGADSGHFLFIECDPPQLLTDLKVWNRPKKTRTPPKDGP